MESITIFPPGATGPAGAYIPSQIQLGSWLMADPGPDYGTKGLIQSIESQNALTDGGRFGFRYAPPRKMAFPLLINSMFGVNRLPNPGFETATYAPWSLFPGNAGTGAVIGNASGGVGSYVFSATGAVGTTTFQMVATIAAVPSGEPMLVAAALADFSPSSAGETARALIQLQNAAGTSMFPDTAAPGYVFGYSIQGSPGVGAFSAMTLPNGQWTRVGGIMSAAGMASLISGGLPIRVRVNPMQIPSAGGLAGASYVTVGVDEIEFRSAYPQRAVREYESQLREYVHPGAFFAVQPEGVPTSEAVYFDVLDGRYEPDHNIYHHRAGVRSGTLFIDTQPYGYWPTEILLASAASIGWNGQLAVNGASVIGDVPPLAHIIIQPTSASVYAVGSWMTDMVAWSLAGQPSFQPLIPPAAFVCVGTAPQATGFGGASLAGDKYAPASQAWVVVASPAQLSSLTVSPFPPYNDTGTTGADIPWTQILNSGPSAIPSGLEPAYRGRYRVFAFARLTPSTAPWQLLVDAERFTGMERSMASANNVATNYSVVGTAIWLHTASYAMPSPAYSLLDMGELSLPPEASGYQQPVTFRVWAAPPSGAFNAPATVTQLYFGGLYLLPVDGPAGILTGGMVVPTIGGWVTNTPTGATVIQGGLEMGNQFVESFYITSPSAGLQALDARTNHRGVSPRLGASTSKLTFVTGDRLVSATYPVTQANLEYSKVSVSYRPTFEFMYGT